MQTTGAGIDWSATDFEREIGRYEGPADGPVLICIGAMHGNEPAGALAIQRVLRRLRSQRLPLRGSFIGLIGNVAALRKQVRFIDQDLNRMWTAERLAAIAGGASSPGRLTGEAREQLELYQALQRLIAEEPRELIFLDLHTTSAPSPPFAIFADTLRNRRFASHFPVPLVLGLEERLSGILMEFLTELGYITLAFEAGRHQSPESVEFHEAAIWIALAAAGMLRPAVLADFDQYRDKLAGAAQSLPRFLEVRFRHALNVDDRFCMQPGFNNFQPIRAGELLAEDRNGKINAPSSGRILMPRYQGLGDDGFFLVRAVRPMWLRVSALLRILHADALIRLLPGVRRHPVRPQTLIIDQAIARWFPLEILHLLGYRQQEVLGTTLLASKRRFDVRPPAHRR